MVLLSTIAAPGQDLSALIGTLNDSRNDPTCHSVMATTPVHGISHCRMGDMPKTVLRIAENDWAIYDGHNSLIAAMRLVELQQDEADN